MLKLLDSIFVKVTELVTVKYIAALKKIKLWFIFVYYHL